ncbi:ABC transporter ATP-binding protein [Microbacterium pygmaeum]|uniref:Peptide/nickel transport system ATP-binding protein n=1 Tax=Microbacterium pygmaeum TaxID=370764 RepID=A0A1G7YY21_9MICO|nr:ABC transporter ATP-binding protein [Microbacterium pygmaeum]SDH01156.1 peptide/nickel transport system ATP-binding protein [Microbacterium pygmaeum]
MSLLPDTARAMRPAGVPDSVPLAPSFDEASLIAPALLEVEGLRVSASDGSELVHGVDVSIRRGDALGIVGESGSGKTLTCRAMLGILPIGTRVTGGRILIDGRDMAGARQKDWLQIRGKRVAAVFQDPASYLNPSAKVGAQLEEVLRVTAGASRRDARERAFALLTRLDLRNVDRVSRQRIGELSGGMLQRVLIAMALAADPDVLIADEATTALDVTVQAEILDLLRDLRAERDLALVLVSHDLAVVSQVCERVMVFRDGEVVERGATARVLKTPAHPYTRSLLTAHARYGLERYLGSVL